jgi:hypothetical protein
MDFSGPEVADFANVRALNHAFLLRLREPRQGRDLRRHLPPAIATLIEGLTTMQVERLATAPFLLLSLGESDEASWCVPDAGQANLDLLGTAEKRGDELLTTAVSFLWQLAGRNSYAARLVSGASIGWCERLAECTLLNALQAATDHEELIQPRCAANEWFWRKLLGPGLSSAAAVRRSAHITCLQCLLTDTSAAPRRQIRAAACEKSVPTLSVKEKPGRR